MKRCLGKKGSIQDLIMIAVVLLVFSVVILIGFRLSSSMNEEIQASDKLDQRGKDSFASINNMFPGVVDNSFMFLLIGLSIGAIVLAAMVRIHPIFIALFIIVWVIIIFLSAVFSNIYQEMASNPQMADLAAQLTFTNQIMTTLPWIIAIIGGLLAIIMYKVYKNDMGGF